MPIDYRRPTKAPTAPVAAPVSPQRRNARYWLDQYRRLTREIQAAQVTNNDQWRKEQVNTRALYSQRAAAAAQMADALEALL